MRRKKFNNQLRKVIRDLVCEALANKFGQGGDVAAAEQVANSVWGSVYNVMPKGERKNTVFYRVTLHSSSGPVKYLKQDAQGRWFSMNPPQQIWRPVDSTKVATEPETAAAPIQECDCAPGCNCPGDPMKGDTTDVRTMDAVNVAEGMKYNDYLKGGSAVREAYFKWKELAKWKKTNVIDFVAGWNAALEHVETLGLNEMTGTGAVAGYQTPFAFSKRSSGSKKAMDATKKAGYKLAKKGYQDE